MEDYQNVFPLSISLTLTLFFLPSPSPPRQSTSPTLFLVSRSRSFLPLFKQASGFAIGHKNSTLFLFPFFNNIPKRLSIIHDILHISGFTVSKLTLVPQIQSRNRTEARGRTTLLDRLQYLALVATAFQQISTTRIPTRPLALEDRVALLAILN